MNRIVITSAILLGLSLPLGAASVPWRMLYGIRETVKAGQEQAPAEPGVVPPAFSASEVQAEPKIRVLLYEGTQAVVVGVPQGGDIVTPAAHVDVPVLSNLRVLELGGEVCVETSTGQVVVRSPGPLRICPRGQLNAGTHLLAVGADRIFSVAGSPYRGELQVSVSAGQLQFVNTVGLEAYLYGVVPRELNSDTLEAVKAQAVVSRTYALGHVRPGQPYDVVGDVRAQAYGGMRRETIKTSQAIDETAGQILTWRGHLARDVCYCATCGGLTASNQEVFHTAPIAYLQSVSCAPELAHRDGMEAEGSASAAANLADAATQPSASEPASAPAAADIQGGLGEEPASSFCSCSPYYRWTVRWTGPALEESLRRALKVPPGVPFTGLKPAVTAPDGRVERLVVEFGGMTRTVTGEAIRSALSFIDEQGKMRPLYSTCFTLRTEDDGVAWVAEGRGWGHGVGMCQWGAIGMARQGHTYDEILRHYFPGTELAAGHHPASGE